MLVAQATLAVEESQVNTTHPQKRKPWNISCSILVVVVAVIVTCILLGTGDGGANTTGTTADGEEQQQPMKDEEGPFVSATNTTDMTADGEGGAAIVFASSW